MFYEKIVGKLFFGVTRLNVTNSIVYGQSNTYCTHELNVNLLFPYLSECHFQI